MSSLAAVMVESETEFTRGIFRWYEGVIGNHRTWSLCYCSEVLCAV